MDEFEYYISGLSIPEVSRATGIPLSTLRFRFKKAGILRTRTEGVVNAAKKGLIGRPGVKVVFSDEWRENIRSGKLAHGEKYAKGFSLKPSGYIEITRGENKGRSEHCVIMEEIIGRRMFSNECVHHINEIRSDNRPENLEIMTRSEHMKLHQRRRKK